MSESEEMKDASVSDGDIVAAIKMLEDADDITDVSSIERYKASTRKLFEQLLFKLEENSDYIYSLEHRIKFLEQECEDKDADLDKMSNSMQQAVSECRNEAEDMVNELMEKVSLEVGQRRDVELLARRLQKENAKLKDHASMQKVPGWEKDLDTILHEVSQRETRAYQEECDDLRSKCSDLEKKFTTLQLQREAEMNATASVIKFAQSKIESLHLQLKMQQKKEMNQRSNKKKQKNSKFNTPTKSMKTGTPDANSNSNTPISPKSPSSSPSSSINSRGNDKALHNRRSSRGKKNKNKSSEKGIKSNDSASVDEINEFDSDKRDLQPETVVANGGEPKKVSPDILRQKSKSFWSRFEF